MPHLYRPLRLIAPSSRENIRTWQEEQDRKRFVRKAVIVGELFAVAIILTAAWPGIEKAWRVVVQLLVVK